MLDGPRLEIDSADDMFPDALRHAPQSPERLFVIGNASAMQEGIAVVGARRATPYGLGCAERFARLAANRGIAIISGGARGCDSKAHEAALSAGTPTVVFLGGGCDRIYPAENFDLFQRIIDAGGAIVSEHLWTQEPIGYQFRTRNRLIAGLAKATLIVEAGLPSGTFSTADYALDANREVLAVPGSITSKNSRGANRLIAQGACPIIDDETFCSCLDSIFGESGNSAGTSKQSSRLPVQMSLPDPDDPFFEVANALSAKPMTLESMHRILYPKYAEDTMARLMLWLTDQMKHQRISKYPDGTYGPNL